MCGRGVEGAPKPCSRQHGLPSSGDVRPTGLGPKCQLGESLGEGCCCQVLCHRVLGPFAQSWDRGSLVCRSSAVGKAPSCSVNYRSVQICSMGECDSKRFIAVTFWRQKTKSLSKYKKGAAWEGGPCLSRW